MLLDRIMKMFRAASPPSPNSTETTRATQDLHRAIERADAVADHVTITADIHKRRGAALTAYAEEVAEHMREVWGPQ